MNLDGNPREESLLLSIAAPLNTEFFYFHAYSRNGEQIEVRCGSLQICRILPRHFPIHNSEVVHHFITKLGLLYKRGGSRNMFDHLKTFAYKRTRLAVKRVVC